MMNHQWICCIGLTVAATVTAWSLFAGIPDTALPDGTTSVLAVAPGLLCAAALLLLPAVDKGWAYATGAVTLLAVPAIAAAVTAVLTVRQRDPDHAGAAAVHTGHTPSSSWASVIRSDEAMVGAFAVAERWVGPVLLSSACLLFIAARPHHHRTAAPQTSHGVAGTCASVQRTSPSALCVVAAVAQALLIVTAFAIPVLSWQLSHARQQAAYADDDVYSMLAGKGGPVRPDELALRALLTRLTVCFLIISLWIVATNLRVRFAVQCHPTAIVVMIVGLIMTLHSDATGGSIASQSQQFSATPLQTVPLFSFSVMEMLHLVRLGIVVVTAPLLCATITAHCDSKGQDDYRDAGHHVSVHRKEKLIDIV